MKRWYLTIIVIGVALIVLAAFAQPNRAGSTFSARGSGTLALFRFLQQTGFPAHQWLKPFSELPQEGERSVLFLISPESIGDENALLNWVAVGNSLILAESPATETLLRFLGFQDMDAATSSLQSALRRRDDPVKVREDAEGRVAEALAGVTHITYPGPIRYPLPPHTEIVSGPDSEPQIIRLRVGDGDVWFFPEPAPFANDNIDKFDNIKFIYQLVVPSSRPFSRVLFDEFHHGFTAPAPETALRQLHYLTALGAGLFLVLLLVTLSRAVRFGPPVPRHRAAAPTTTDLTSAIGLLYRDYDAFSSLRSYRESWRERAARALGMSASAPISAVITALSRRLQPADGSRLRETLSALDAPESAQHLNDGDIRFLEGVTRQ